MSKNSEKALELIHSGYNVNKSDNLNNSPLIYSITRNMPEVALELIHMGQSNIGQISRHKLNTALLHSITKQMPGVALELIRTGNSMPGHVNEDGNTALLLSIRANMPKVALALIQTGQSKPEHVNQVGNTALIYACASNLSDVALALIQTGQSKPEHLNNDGTNALYFARSNRMRLVILKLTPPVATTYSSVTPVDSLVKSDKQLDASSVGNDCIEFTSDDLPVLETLRENKDNIAFLFGNHYFVTNKEMIARASMFPEDIKYKCPTINSMSGIVKTVPYLNMKSIAIFIGLVPLNELKYCVTTESVQLVEIDNSQFDELPSTVSLQVLMPGANNINASHCQDGQGERAFHLKLMDLPGEGGGRHKHNHRHKRKTRRYKKQLSTTKRQTKRLFTKTKIKMSIK